MDYCKKSITMKNKILAFITVFIIVLSAAFPTYAANTPKEGIYEVEITLLHAEKDRESMGNSYILQTALLEVDGSEMFLTMVQSGDVDGLQFWYYNDGSVSGDSTEAQEDKDVTIKENTYPIGYKFPIVSQGETVGVKFKASSMPLTPSARVKINYDSAVFIKAIEPPTTESLTTKKEVSEDRNNQTSIKSQSDDNEENSIGKMFDAIMYSCIIGGFVLLIILCAVITLIIRLIKKHKNNELQNDKQSNMRRSKS